MLHGRTTQCRPAHESEVPGLYGGGATPHATDSERSRMEPPALHCLASDWHEAVLATTQDPGFGQTLVPDLQFGARVHCHRLLAAPHGNDFAGVVAVPQVDGAKTTPRLGLGASHHSSPGLVSGAGRPAHHPRAAKGGNTPGGITSGWAAHYRSGRGRSAPGGIRNGGRGRSTTWLSRITLSGQRVGATIEPMANASECLKVSRGGHGSRGGPPQCSHCKCWKRLKLMQPAENACGWRAN